MLVVPEGRAAGATSVTPEIITAAMPSNSRRSGGTVPDLARNAATSMIFMPWANAHPAQNYSLALLASPDTAVDNLHLLVRVATFGVFLGRGIRQYVERFLLLL
jgi:hypothetical protein